MRRVSVVGVFVVTGLILLVGAPALGQSSDRQWFVDLRARAEEGDPSAQLTLGTRYETGIGVPQDTLEAVRWYRLGADQGHPGSLWSLGTMYAYGLGVTQDDMQAHLWSSLTVSRASGALLQKAVRARDRVAARLTPDQLVESELLAREWQANHPR